MAWKRLALEWPHALVKRVDVFYSAFLDRRGILTDMSLISLLMLTAVLVAMLWRVGFWWRAEWRVGQVVEEWRYRAYGSPMRYYRVEYALSNGQRLQIRSMAAHPALQPALGTSVSVLVEEREGRAPRAQIITVWDLSFSLIFALLLSLPGLVVLWAHRWV